LIGLRLGGDVVPGEEGGKYVVITEDISQFFGIHTTVFTEPWQPLWSSLILQAICFPAQSLFPLLILSSTSIQVLQAKQR
jgi:hypothetical protein